VPEVTHCQRLVQKRPHHSTASPQTATFCAPVHTHTGKRKGSLYSVAERWVPELTLVLGSQPAGDVSHKPGGRLPLLSSKPAVTPATLN